MLSIKRCGRSLSGIISTARRVRYEQWLSALGGERSAQGARLPPVMDQGGDLGLPAISDSLSNASSIPPLLHQDPSSAGGVGRNNSPSAQGPGTYERYLLWCITSGLGPTRRGRTVVRLICVATGDRDEQVFNKLRKKFYQTRGFWRIASLHAISEIRYVRVCSLALSYVSA